jgi:protein-S-isoprenylcysteine O-methyltransferase Ste14
VFALVFFYRPAREQAMMIKTYGGDYRGNMKRVGGVLPKPG